MSQYPSPDHLHVPEAGDPSPDQQYVLGWFAQHNRLWLAFLGSFGLNVILAILLLTQTAKYRPTIQYVTLDGGGYPVTWNAAGNAVIDSVEYVPARLRAVVSNFIENRYAYDWQNLAKINSALRLMSGDAQTAERQKIQDINPANNIVAVRLKVGLKMDYTTWKVTPQGKGRFQVVVDGTAEFTDAIRNTDPANPATKPVQIKLTVQAGPATDLNPLGYLIVATDKDILF